MTLGVLKIAHVEQNASSTRFHAKKYNGWLVGVYRPFSAQIRLYQKRKWRFKASDILTSTLVTFLFSSHPKWKGIEKFI